MGRAEDLRRHAGWTVFAVLAATVAVGDQLLKHWIVAHHQPNTPAQVLGDWLRIDFIHNTGGLFGLFQNAAGLFALVSLAVVAILVGLEFRWGWRSWLVTVALGLLLGGAIGNLIDRITLGYVVDFADIGVGTWRFYIFNVADSAVTVSIGLLLLVSLLSPRSLSLGNRDTGSKSEEAATREAVTGTDDPRGPVAG